jgi:two-component system cell cycle sensor histidine kinase/response regulator CckA
MRSGTANKKRLLLEASGRRADTLSARENLTIPQSRSECLSPGGESSATGAPARTKPAGASVPAQDRAIRYNLDDPLGTYQQVVAGVREGITIHDSAGRIIQQNESHRNLLGYPDSEILGKTPAWYLEGGREAFRRVTEELQQQPMYRGEARCRTRSGSWLEVELRAVAIRNGAGNICGYAIFVDVATEKKRIEDALRESEERFNVFMNNSSVVAFMRDVGGRYVYVNRAFEKYVGKRSTEILGKTPFEIWPQEIAKALAEADKQVLAAGQPIEMYEKTALPGDEETREWLTIKFPFHDRRQNVFVGSVSIDVTERKSLEEQLRQSQKMEAVGRLAGGIAHDFNNLLTIITGYCELLLNSSGVNEDQRGKIEEIKRAGDRAALLTRQLLAFSRKQVLAPRVLDLNVVIENLRKMIERLIGEDIEFVTVPSPKLDMVRADPGQVEQIIMNLVVNARDAMPHGGRLTIETANVELDEAYARAHRPSLPGHYVMIAVTDSGMGMDSETQKRIFEPFFTTKEQGKGTGLGLATVYGIVKQSGGFIWVYSEPGVGSSFKIYFPRVPGPMETLPADHIESGQLEGSETILVAEDEQSLRLLIKETLERHGYKVLVASDGKQALRMSSRFKGPIHLLIADVVMPQMGGRQLAGRLTASRSGIGVLYISGYTDDAIVHHGILDPNTAFLQKPFSPDSLARKVRMVLSAHQGKNTLII